MDGLVGFFNGSINHLPVEEDGAEVECRSPGLMIHRAVVPGLSERLLQTGQVLWDNLIADERVSAIRLVLEIRQVFGQSGDLDFNIVQCQWMSQHLGGRCDLLTRVPLLDCVLPCCYS